MKDAKFIINHIVNDPFFHELKSRNECGEFLKLLGLNYRRLITFCYVKNNILFFALNHPLGLQELKRDSSINMIKGLLKIYSNFNKASKFAQISDIKFFVTKNLRFKIEVKKTPKILYIERSKGEFVNLAKDEQIHAKFETIREKIRANLNAT